MFTGIARLKWGIAGKSVDKCRSENAKMKLNQKRSILEQHRLLYSTTEGGLVKTKHLVDLKILHSFTITFIIRMWPVHVTVRYSTRHLIGHLLHVHDIVYIPLIFLPPHWSNVVCCTCMLIWPIIAHRTNIIYKLLLFLFLCCMPDKARDGGNVALKWQLEVKSHLLACLIVQNNHPTTNPSMPNNVHAIYYACCAKLHWASLQISW